MPSTVRAIAVAALMITASSAASAATLTLTSDKDRYRVGETIHLEVLGQTEEGEEDREVFGRLLYDPLLADTISSSQSGLTTSGTIFLGGEITVITFVWALFDLENGDGYTTMFNQSRLVGDTVVDQDLISTAQLIAEAPGVLDFQWIPGSASVFEPGDPLGLDFFGVYTHPGLSIAITPEPSTALLIAVGLLGLAAGNKL